MTTNPAYRGRFAPSPTGPLHFGSLVAAVGSFLDAKSQGGAWLVRLEDLDTERNVPGADADILRCLEAFGLLWDGPIARQSERIPLYQAALETLERQGQVYPCSCSRKLIAGNDMESADRIYPGTCRQGLPAHRNVRSIRFKTNEIEICFNDALQGEIRQNVAAAVGDFVVKRADGPFAYQLAVVVDDADQGITDVVRGADLLDSTPRQIALQRALGLPTPRYLHLPLATNARGEKLSKQTRAPAVRPEPSVLVDALRFLGWAVPPEAAENNLQQIIEYAVQHYDSTHLLKQIL